MAFARTIAVPPNHGVGVNARARVCGKSSEDTGLCIVTVCLPSPPGAGACFGQTRISVGKASKRLTYVDQVLQLVYEDGSPCPSKSGLRYKSVISFVCRPEAGPTNRPMLISLDKRTCTLFFSWHTPLACEQVVSPGCTRTRGGRPGGPGGPPSRGLGLSSPPMAQ